MKNIHPTTFSAVASGCIIGPSKRSRLQSEYVLRLLASAKGFSGGPASCRLTDIRQESNIVVCPLPAVPFLGIAITLDNMQAKTMSAPPPTTPFCFSVIVPYMLISFLLPTMTGLQRTHLLTELEEAGVHVHICLFLFYLDSNSVINANLPCDVGRSRYLSNPC